MLTRLGTAWLADHPGAYGAGGTEVTGDPERYRFWGRAVMDERIEPYADVAIEYPPGALPFVAGPALWESAGHSYRTGFIAFMLLVDAAGLAGLARLSARGGAGAGAWLWVALVPLLGPVAYLRLDLVPAVATIWCLERAAAGAWATSGAWLGYGIAAKVYPVLLLPATWLGAGRRGRLTLGALGLLVVPLLPFVGVLRELWDSVAGYHAARGIQVESTWGLLLLALSKSGTAVSVAYNFGAFHVAAAPAPALKLVATILTAAAVLATTGLVGRAVPRADVGDLAAAMTATLAAALALTTVFSPQFILWLGAPAAAWMCLDARVARPALLVLPAAALSQALYPFLYNRLLAAQTLPLLTLAARNLLVALVALGAVAALLRLRRA